MEYITNDGNGNDDHTGGGSSHAVTVTHSDTSPTLLSVVDKILVLSNLTLSGTATAHRTLSGARRDALEKVEEIYTLVL